MSTSVVARTGRDLQRYDNNLRLVSGCIPFRMGNDECICMDNKIEVLMVSSPNRDDLVFPKGGWEIDETVEEAACREALEEAGVRGILKGSVLGVWEFRSKSKQDACCEEGGCKGYMFALEVTEELETWPEQNSRDRKWVVIEEAFELCRYEWMRSALGEFVRMIMKEDIDKRKHPCEKEKDPIILPSPPHHDEIVEERDYNEEDSQVLSTGCQCHSKDVSSSFGIMLPAGIFL